MGGQACVLYGAAEFSRDTDLAILASEENAERLTKVMQALEVSGETSRGVQQAIPCTPC